MSKHVNQSLSGIDRVVKSLVVHTARDDATRMISFRPASTLEREVYDVRLGNKGNDPQ